MYVPVEYKDLKENCLFIDVRSPSEYKESTINGAINIPIFNDEERKEIGTIYVNESKEKAKKIGVEVASKKLPTLYEEILSIYKDRANIVFFCARGGMRSGVLTMFLTAMGINAIKLKGGYKGYRKHVISELVRLNDNVEYIVLHGNTGVGKTEILKKLEIDGYNVLDLEGCANHRGSMLGGVGLGKQFGQKQFESNIYHSIKDAENKYVFVEAESSRIGNIYVPKFILDKMKKGRHIFIDADIEYRSNLIVNEYTRNGDCENEIRQSLDRLNKYISKENIDKYNLMLKDQNYNEVAKDLMIKYYDPMYMHNAKKYKYDIQIKENNLDDYVNVIKKWFAELES